MEQVWNRAEQSRTDRSDREGALDLDMEVTDLSGRVGYIATTVS